MGIADRYRAWEKRADAWAAKCLSREEFEEATELDRVLKANAASLALVYLLVTIVYAMLLLGIKPALGMGKAFVVANIILASLALGLAGVWFGYRRHVGKPLWRTALSITLLCTAGAVVGAAAIRFFRGGDLADLGTEELVRLGSIGVLAGTVVAVLVVGATWVRMREARAREASLRSEAERERLAKRMIEAELKLLQAQVEPHFLFNTLANLRWLVQTSSPDALVMLDHLIEYLRTALPEMRSASSTVDREAAMARAYLEILGIRMGGELAFSIEVEPGLGAHVFPPLMLMTMVENAVKHGVAPAGRGRVEVRVMRSQGKLRIEVDDDGRGVAREPGKGVGLANVRERLAALYGDSASLGLVTRASGGARAVLEIPEAG